MRAVSQIVIDFAALKDKLPAIQSFSHGRNISPENLAQGFTHCFELRFASQKEFLESYLHEPADRKSVV